MKRTITLLAITLLSVSYSFAQWNKKIKGNGNVTTVTRTTSDYDGIKCAGSFDYVLVKGKEGKITLEGESNLLEYIVTEVKNNKLVVKVENNVNLRTSSNKEIRITIPFEDIDEVSMAGSGDLTSKDVITSNNLKVAMAGSGKVNLDLKANTVKGSMAGSGNLTLSGSTNSLEADIAGSGDFNGFGLDANETDVSVAGSGDAEVVSNKSLKARVAGSGDIRYKGNPEKEDTKVAGSGKISN
ncbi:head GIN domain-containing protein [Aegicerativicinus sediminis]